MYLCAENNSLVCKTWNIWFCCWNFAYITTDWSWLIGWAMPCRTLCRLISIYAPTPPSDELHRVFIICKDFCFYFCFPFFCRVSLHIELQNSHLLSLSVLFFLWILPPKRSLHLQSKKDLITVISKLPIISIHLGGIREMTSLCCSLIGRSVLQWWDNCSKKNDQVEHASGNILFLMI